MSEGKKIDNDKYLMKEIDIIQNIIKRMASNSFLIKGWSISLVTVTLLLNTKEYQNFIALIPWITFWILDGYFLRQERLFRKLYEWVIENRKETTKFLFDMRTGRFEDEVDSIPSVMFSPTLRLFHLTIFLIVIIYSLLVIFL